MSTVMTTPERSLVQRMEALRAANEVRSYRARMKVQMKAGSRSALEVLAEMPTEVETMRVVDLLVATPKCGRVKANAVLNRCKISPAKHVGGLSERQRRELTAVLSGSRVPQSMVTYPTTLL